MRVWITRAAPGAEATAARLEALGHTPLLGSLLETRALDPILAEPPADMGGLAFTSANAVRAFCRWSPRRGVPVFAVGAATAAAARSAGFEVVRSADGDVDALAKLIAARPSAGTILHPCAREAAGDLSGALASVGVKLQPLTLYETVAIGPAPCIIQTWALGEVEAVMLHSPKGARALASWLAGAPVLVSPSALALGLSAACLEPLPAACFVALRAASAPREAALLALLA